MLPARVNPHDKTEGVLMDSEHAIVHDPVFAAEDDGRLRSRQVRLGQRLAAAVGLRPPLSGAYVMDHVEAHAAAIMRQPGAPRVATLVVNQTPCDDPTRPLVCDRVLPKILPAGARLTVYVTDGNQTWEHRTYTGTAKGIA
jgi:hypothetical protein